MPRNKQKQETIAKEVFEQQERIKLKKMIRLLERVPTDFRDIDVGSPDWEAFADATNRRKEMTDWANGLTICLEEPNKHEKMVLNEYFIPNLQCNFSHFRAINWFELLFTCQNRKASWLYLPEEEGTVIHALNVFVSRAGTCYRIKGSILSERTGKRIGVVH